MICTRCKVEKPFSDFYKDSRRKSGCSNWCKCCTKQNVSSWQKQNKEARKLTCKRYREKNAEKLLDVDRQRADKFRVYGKNFRKRHPDKHAANQAKRRADKMQATPCWLSAQQKQEISYLYWLAKDLSKISGESYHVDHIVPLKNDLVCGLHVPWNLQVLPADLNLSKGNKINADS